MGDQAKLVERTDASGSVSLEVEGTEPPAWAYTLEAFVAMRNAAIYALGLFDQDAAKDAATQAVAEENAKAPPPIPEPPTPVDSATTEPDTTPAVGPDGIPEALRTAPPAPKPPRQLDASLVKKPAVSVKVDKAQALTPPTAPIQQPRVQHTAEGPVVPAPEAAVPTAPLPRDVLPSPPAFDASEVQNRAYERVVGATQRVLEDRSRPIEDRVADQAMALEAYEALRESEATDREALANTMAVGLGGLAAAVLVPPAAPMLLGGTAGALRDVAEQNVVEKVPLDRLDLTRVASAGAIGGLLGATFQQGAQVLPKVTNAAGVTLSTAAALHGGKEVIEGAASQDLGPQFLGAVDMFGAGAAIPGAPGAARDAARGVRLVWERIPIFPAGPGAPPPAVVSGSGGQVLLPGQPQTAQAGATTTTGGGRPTKGWHGNVLATTGGGETPAPETRERPPERSDSPDPEADRADSNATTATIETSAEGPDWRIAPHVDQPSPRPAGFQAHHGVNSVWAEWNLPGYSHENSPTMLMRNAPSHNATRAVFNKVRAEIAVDQGVSPRDIDWTKVSTGRAWRLAEEQFEAAGVPEADRDLYFRAFNEYIDGLE